MSAKVKNGEQVINPPSWYFTYTLRTKPQTNEKGDWYGWDISRSNPVTPDIYAEGKAFNASVKKVMLKSTMSKKIQAQKKQMANIPFK